MEEILLYLNQIIELVQTLICVNLLFRKRYYFRPHDAVFVAAEVVFLELANSHHLNGAVVIVAYIGIYIYAVAKFKEGCKRTLVNVVLFLIINPFIQLACSGLVFLASLALPFNSRGTVGVFIINLLALLIIFIVSRKERLYRISRYVLRSDWLTRIAMIGSLFVIAYLIIAYKASNYFRATDYFVFGAVMVLLCVLALSWQKEKCEKTAREKEIALREEYDSMFEDLVTSVRRKQHDIDDQINMIYCQHKVAHSLEELVSMQRDYCEWIEDDSAFSRLLSVKNPIIGGFLYSKLGQAKEEGCSVKFDVKVGKLACSLPIYKMVEILTVLLNNAIEALENREKKSLYVKMAESDEEINVLVRNSYDYIPQKELSKFIQLGYSTKGKNRGLGLANVMDILQECSGEMEIQSEETEDDAWVSFEIFIKKEGTSPSLKN